MFAKQQGQVSLLQAEPGLAKGLDQRTRDLATSAVWVDVRVVDPGPWEPSRGVPQPGHLGFLTLKGLMTRELLVAGARSLELLGRGDLLRPWQEDAASFVEARWRVLRRVELAVLDHDAVTRLSAFPAVVESLVAAVMHRSRSLAIHAAIENMRGLEDRLFVLFWQMAERWGTVSTSGVHVPLDLTHQMLADLVGARRPSVSLALGKLAEEKRLRRDPAGGWLLSGEAPSPHWLPKDSPSAKHAGG